MDFRLILKGIPAVELTYEQVARCVGKYPNRILVTGDQIFKDFNVIRRNFITLPADTIIITTDTFGAPAIAQYEASEMTYPVVVLKTKWAGPKFLAYNLDLLNALRPTRIMNFTQGNPDSMGRDQILAAVKAPIHTIQGTNALYDFPLEEALP